ncbi:MAG: hypothetical protein JWO13_132 [Acidobacteriales bacterium]|nr:hypothetical protein [Terriglobales bacterium]
MTSRTVYCLVDSGSQAEQVVEQLKDAAFTSQDISVIMPDNSGTKFLSPEFSSKAPEGAVAGAGTGVVLGGVLGWLTGIGALALPGFGPLLAAGPLMTALAGAAAGTAVGGLAGALIGLGIPESDVNRFVGRVQEGCAFIAVRVDDSEMSSRARHVFESFGASEIAEVGIDDKSQGEERKIA